MAYSGRFSVKLSDAISLGSMLTPQAVGTFKDALGGRCALGSAVHAIGHSVYSLKDYNEWKWTMRRTACPECATMATVANVIAHLNDRHRWSRARIARWVAAIEPTEDTSADGEEFASVV